MTRRPPRVVVLAGPNGAGKSTAAPGLLRGTLGVTEFVNADAIAQGLSAFAPEAVAMEAGRVMLRRIKELASKRADFAFETTLASRSFARWLTGLIKSGYQFHLVFLWLPDAATAIARVVERVRLGGHNVPQLTIRRRYASGLKNFFHRYRPLATTWLVIDNSKWGKPKLVAAGRGEAPAVVKDKAAWKQIRKGAGSG